MVHCDELLCAFHDVLVLCFPGHGIPATQDRVYDDHGQPASADVHRLLHQLRHVWLPVGERSEIVWRIPDKRQYVIVHVLQLLVAFRPVLLQRVHQQAQEQWYIQKII